MTRTNKPTKERLREIVYTEIDSAVDAPTHEMTKHTWAVADKIMAYPEIASLFSSSEERAVSEEELTIDKAREFLTNIFEHENGANFIKGILINIWLVILRLI